MCMGHSLSQCSSASSPFWHRGQVGETSLSNMCLYAMAVEKYNDVLKFLSGAGQVIDSDKL